MMGDIFLSQKEAKRVYVMEQVMSGKVTVKQAAELLSLSKRQIKRLKKGMKQEGVAFLAHKNRGRKPKHAIPQDAREQVISLYLDKLNDASCEHMSELLPGRFGIKLSSRSIRRILYQAGIKNPHSLKMPKKRRSRTRMPQEGLLVQCDASPYAWLEDRGPELTLHGIIDDATGQILALYFRPHEELYGYLQVLSQMVQNYGVPRSLYSDRHTIFFSPNKDKLSIEDELAGKKVSLTQFGKALDELGINHIPARSPQAKGRVERLWGTLQGRLTIEMRLEGISTMDQANTYLPKFIERFNQRFGVAATDPDSAFKPTPPADLLDQIIAFREERKASNGSTISLNNVLYQLVNTNGSTVALTPRAKVTVLKHLDGSTSALYQGYSYKLKEFVHPATTSHAKIKEVNNARSERKPSAEHPWRKTAVPKHQEPIESYLERKGYLFRKYAY